MDGSLKFADYVTIAVIVVLAVFAVQWWMRKQRPACACKPPADNMPKMDFTKRPGVRSCT